MKWLLIVAVTIGFTLPLYAQKSDEVRFVRSILGQLQGRSFSQNREYCGYIGRDATGRLVLSKATRGRRDSCAAAWPSDFLVLASFHTHAGFDADAQSEVPSVNDMEADENEGIDGYVATPGGRLWYIDTTDMVASQICSLGCLPIDTRFRAGVDGQVLNSYTYNELIQREAAN